MSVRVWPHEAGRGGRRSKILTRINSTTHDAEPKVGRCHADDGDGAPGLVGRRILANRGVDANGQRYQLPEHQCYEAELNRYR